MNRYLPVILGLLLATPAAAAIQPAGGLGGAIEIPTGPCLTDAQREQIRAEIAESLEHLAAQGLAPRVESAAIVGFEWPLRAGNGLAYFGHHGISNFLDHNPSFPGQLRDYDCGTRTYDTGSGYNHQGTDIFTWPFWWSLMDNAQVEIVAAASGTIIYKSDGNYDRSCATSGGNWNAVYVQHSDGSVAWYGHMKNGSLTPKLVGQTVVTGEYLGVVGSSGNSTGPHLHFEVYNASSQLVDPWAGPCNPTAGASWNQQRPYYDSGLNALMTHDAPPEFPACPGTEVIHADDHFDPGEVAYFAAYYRHQLSGQVSDYSIVDPYGQVWQSWSASLGPPHYAASYWYFYDTIPLDAPHGRWTWSVTYLGQTRTHTFLVGNPLAVDGVGSSRQAPDFAAAYPNPAGEETMLEYVLPRVGPARLAIHDSQGRRVALLASGVQGSGRHRVRWPATAASGERVRPGIYLARLESEGTVRTRKLVVRD